MKEEVQFVEEEITREQLANFPQDIYGNITEAIIDYLNERGFTLELNLDKTPMIRVTQGYLVCWSTPFGYKYKQFFLPKPSTIVCVMAEKPWMDLKEQ